MAKINPATRIPGKTAAVLFYPAIITQRQKGMINDNSGSCLPTILPILIRSIPVT
jgi:hypothetical protein